MRVRFVSVLAGTALLVLFPLKATAMVLPALFDAPSAARVTASLLLSASLLMLVFFTALRAFLEEHGRPALAAVATIGIAEVDPGDENKDNIGFVLVDGISWGLGLQAAFAAGCLVASALILFVGAFIISRDPRHECHRYDRNHRRHSPFCLVQG